jgi:mono/diheme cytochrome c family protein
MTFNSIKEFALRSFLDPTARSGARLSNSTSAVKHAQRSSAVIGGGSDRSGSDSWSSAFGELAIGCFSIAAIGSAGLITGCSDRGQFEGEPDEPAVIVSEDAGPQTTKPSTVGSLTIVSQKPPSDLPLAGLSEHWQERFDDGDIAFDQVFRATQGLGPIYIRQACASCHAADARGPGASRKMVKVNDDGVTPADDQSMFPYGHTIRPQSIDPDTFPGVMEPEPFNGLLLSSRLGPAVFGRGAMEAIEDSEIERLEREQATRSDGISGRINRVTYESEANPETEFHAHAKGESGLIGRFGLKARIATLDEFAADAYQGDMGITSPLRPSELPNPAGATDDGLSGVDVDLDTVNLTGDYVRLLRIPVRTATSDEGKALFDQVQCSACHATGLLTKADYPIPQWANTRVDVYTDMLLHSMGKDLADGIADGGARGDEWRTAPLVGLRHLRGLMHDGRSKTVRAAILAHASDGSEANASVDSFNALTDAEQASLVEFVESL